MSYPAIEKSEIDEIKVYFESHDNPYNLKLSTFRTRVERGESLEEAMLYPSGRFPLNIYRNGWINFEGKWTSVDDLDMIYDKDTTENMIKTGIEIEKLFKRKE